MKVQALLLLAAAWAMAPAMAQDAIATLRIRGNVMISSGGEFTTATDGQPVVVGHRIMVGDDASATVDYSPDCKRSFDSAGVYLIAPGRCDERRNDDGSRSQQAEGGTAASSAGGTWASLGTILGTAVLASAVIDQDDTAAPDRPASR